MNRAAVLALLLNLSGAVRWSHFEALKKNDDESAAGDPASELLWRLEVAAENGIVSSLSLIHI